ncbi:MAG TPA: hypothetical protein VFB66_18190, partial [Tepidisphaeraceae bacterium]|nr:hypothetical protein [Tepidisphaeraceae bacterium]
DKGAAADGAPRISGTGDGQALGNGDGTANGDASTNGNGAAPTSEGHAPDGDSPPPGADE